MSLWPGDKDGGGLTPAQALLNTKCKILRHLREQRRKPCLSSVTQNTFFAGASTWGFFLDGPSVLHRHQRGT